MAGRKRLKSLEDVRRYLSGLVNRLEANEVDPSIAGRLGYLSNILISCIKDSALEQRVDALERKLDNDIKTQN
jgi:hypothetical protein